MTMKLEWRGSLEAEPFDLKAEGYSFFYRISEGDRVAFALTITSDGDAESCFLHLESMLPHILQLAANRHHRAVEHAVKRYDLEKAANEAYVKAQKALKEVDEGCPVGVAPENWRLRSDQAETTSEGKSWDWNCPHCHAINPETWFDRSLSLNSDGEEVMATRCCACGGDIDDVPSPAHPRSKEFLWWKEWFQKASPQEMFDMIGIPPDGYAARDGWVYQLPPKENA